MLQWLNKKKRQKDKQRSTKHQSKSISKDRATRITLKTGVIHKTGEEYHLHV